MCRVTPRAGVFTPVLLGSSHFLLESPVSSLTTHFKNQITLRTKLILYKKNLHKKELARLSSNF